MASFFLLAVAAFIPAAARAVVPVNGVTPTLTPVTINNGAGDQTDPHVSGDWAAYSSDVAIRYYNFLTGADAQIPLGSSARDMLSDVSGSKIVFSRTITGVGTAVMVFDAATAAAPVAIDPAASTIRLGSAIGGNTVAYVDYGLHGNGELVAHDLNTSTSQRITNDVGFDQNPSVSPSGAFVVWEHCTSSMTNCDIWQAVKSGTSWTVSTVQASPNYEANPDTNGTLVVYDSQRAGESDVFWRPVAGGAEVQLHLSGPQRNPSIAGDFIAFESQATFLSSTDIFVHDVLGNRLYQITSTPLVNEQLNDVSVLPDGRIRAVWASDEDGFDVRNVKGATFSLPAAVNGVTIGTPPPAMTQSVVDNSAGHKANPHISGSLVSYTLFDVGRPGIRYHDLTSGTDAAIPNIAPSPIAGATWIWAPGVTGTTAPAELAEFFFTKTISLAAAPTAATFLIAADDFAEVRVNGTIVGTTGSTTVFATAVDAHSALKSLDILPHLTAGTNTITVRGQNGVGSFASCTNCTYKQHPAGVVFGGSITVGSSTVTVESGTSWQAFAGDPASVGATSLGSAQNVCLNASSPAGCPSGATLYGFAGNNWTATNPAFLGHDSESDVSGTRVVFMRIFNDSSIYVFDTAAGAASVELAPSASDSRRNAAIGGNTVAWEDFGFGPAIPQPEIVVHDLVSGATTRLTTDALPDRQPAVSPDGSVVVWGTCQTANTGCDVWKAVKASGSWSASAATGAAGEETAPDTDGQTITYQSLRSGETDIYWQPAAGGAEQQIALTGVQVTPNISSGFIVFESFDVLGGWNIWGYDTATKTLYQLTNSSADEVVSDVSVSATGLVRVVYMKFDAHWDVHALSFQRPASTPSGLLGQLLDDVQVLNLQSQWKNPLLKKLQDALDAVASGKTSQACDKLDAFIGQVQGWSGTKMTAAEATDLVGKANAIKSLLGCP